MFSVITKEEWTSRCHNTCQCEQNYWRLEPIFDDISQQIIVNLQNESSSSVEQEGEEEVEEEDVGEFSGTRAS
jgi:hypothetical protein